MSKTSRASSATRANRFTTISRPTRNLFLMICGHCSDLQEGRRFDVFDGHTVWTLLSDYQTRSNGETAGCES